MADQETKLKFIARITTDPHTRLHDLAKEMGVKYSTLYKWREEYLEAEAAGDVSSVINADELMVARVAEQVRNDLDCAGLPTDGIESSVTKLTSGIDGLRVLDTKLTTAAAAVASRILGVTGRHDLEPRDLLVLANALSSLQSSFFAKGTNVNVLQYNESDGNSGGLKRFKELMNA
jgi:transposase-like protein